MSGAAKERGRLIELIQAAIRDREMDVHVSMPARVESYDAAAQTVDCVPQLNRVLPDGTGNYSPEALPMLAGVPVCFPRAGGFFVSFPIQKDDYVWLVFAERNIGAWLASGDQGDPGDLGMHTLDGAMAIPGVYPSNKALGDASDTDMVLGKDGTASAQVRCTADKVELGGNDQFIALAQKVLDRLTSIKSSFDDHVHVGTSLTANVATGAITGSTLAPTTPMGTPASVAAQNVKAT